MTATVTNSVHNSDGDHYLDLKTLSERSCISVRTLRDHLKDPECPLPGYRLKGKVLIRWSEFNNWMERHRLEVEDFNKKIEDAVSHLTGDA